jgi:multidrug efflux system outer membrane protein
MKRLAFIGSLIAIAALAGCAVGPNYHRPQVMPTQAVPEKFSDTSLADTNQGAWKIAEPSSQIPRGAWWQIFGDAKLDELESLALTNNQNIAAAVANMEQSRYLVSAAQSAFYPQLNAGGTPNGDFTRQRTSENGPIQGNAAGFTHTYDTFTAPLYLGWEFDLWGRIRRLSEAARQNYLASADDLESTKLTLTAAVAADYFSVRTLDDRFTLITNTIETYKRSLELTENRRRGGIVSDLDVAQAATQLHTAEAELPDIKLNRAQFQHALAILCGQSPIDFVIEPAASNDTVVPFVPASLPSVLLEHRPDVASAERRMRAANADIGVAEAAFFPTVRLDGLAGFQSVSASTWLLWPSRFWSVGPSVELPVFTGGLNRANLKAARAAYNVTVANYRQTVLTAFGDVEDQLAAQRLLADEWDGQNAALSSSRHALEIALNRYKSGLITYLDVASAQTDTLTHEDAVAELQGARLIATINLIKSLGCTWQLPAK